MYRMFLQSGYSGEVTELAWDRLGKLPSSMEEAVWGAEVALVSLGYKSFTRVTKPDGTVMLVPDGVDAMSKDVPAVLVEWCGDMEMLS